MKKILTIIILSALVGCATSEKDEFDIIPEYIDYNLNEETLVALYNMHINTNWTYYKY